MQNRFFLLLLLGNETFAHETIKGMVAAGTEGGINYNAKGNVDFLLKNQTIIFLLTIPLFSLASYFTFYKQDLILRNISY